ncbi:chromosome partitioning protein [Mycobacterium antarcticum]|uniref:polysaccharide biosynthesis tyrosine autokinase n=1 Tax=Mycolicibacterium sp. TUM20985 TaxID=3023370 RepID=UPI002572ECE6|nr:polysaccharide biosynthesis tyrosine autokinase [Mycolicibacterium sp. TUM20985]BDX33869.1 chromosome partitioning protein [Mycolicibacterium sp. TUM20985]
MEIKEYLRIFSRYWWVIVILAVVGGAIGWATWQFGTREYQSTATLFVATQNGTTVTEAYQNNLFSTDRANSYANLATSEQVAARAVDQLKGTITPGELKSKITAVAAPKTVLLSVSVTDPDPALAQTYAGAVTDQLVGLVSELETSRRGGTPAAGAVVVDEANYPSEPVGMSMPIKVALGAAAGLLLGILAAILIGALDRRVRGREPVAASTDSSLMGGLPADPSRAKADVVDLDRGGLYAERLRELRTNLRFARLADDPDPPKVIAVTSPSAGEGRTTLAMDLAATLAESGRNVILVDGDFRSSSLADRLPLSPAMQDSAAARGLSTTIAGETNVVEAIIEVPVGHHRVSFLPAGPTPSRPGELWASDRATELLDELGDSFDYVVIDTPPLGKYSDGALVASLSDGALLLARIRRTTSAALRRAVQTLEGANAILIGTVATFEPGHRRQLNSGKPAPQRAAPKPAAPKSAASKSAASKADPPTEEFAAADQRAASRHGSD